MEKWILKKYIRTPDNFNSYKVIIARANGNGDFGETLVDPYIGKPGYAHTDTFLSVGKFKTHDEAQATLKYISTKFVRALLGSLKITHDNFSEKWANVPLQDFTQHAKEEIETSNHQLIDWTKSITRLDPVANKEYECETINEIDAQLYKKYGLTKEEVQFIEKMIKPMD